MELNELDLNAVEVALTMLESDRQLSQWLCGHSGSSEVSVGNEPKRKKRARDPAIDVRRRERRRAERQELKQQAEDYEKQLRDLLEQDRRAHAEKNADSLSPWEEQARNQQRLRDASEELNSKLRARLTENLDLAAQVGSLLKKAQSDATVQEDTTTSLPCGAAALLLLPSAKPYDPSDTTPSLCPFADAIMKEARSMLRESSSMTSSILDCFMAAPGMASISDVSSSSRVRPANSASGPCVELLTSTPVPRDLGGTIHIIWEWLQSKRRSNIPGIRYSSTSRLVTQRGIEVKYKMQFPDDKLDDVIFYGATMLERHELADCVALVFSTFTVQTTGALQFREKGWILINRSPLDPLHNSVVRCCYRVSADQVSSGTSSGQDQTPAFEHLRGVVQGKLTRRMRTRFKELQCELLRESGHHELCSTIEI